MIEGNQPLFLVLMVIALVVADEVVAILSLAPCSLDVQFAGAHGGDDVGGVGAAGLDQ